MAVFTIFAHTDDYLGESWAWHMWSETSNYAPQQAANNTIYWGSTVSEHGPYDDGVGGQYYEYQHIIWRYFGRFNTSAIDSEFIKSGTLSFAMSSHNWITTGMEVLHNGTSYGTGSGVFTGTRLGRVNSIPQVSGQYFNISYQPETITRPNLYIMSRSTNYDSQQSVTLHSGNNPTLPPRLMVDTAYSPRIYKDITHVGVGNEVLANGNASVTVPLPTGLEQDDYLIMLVTTEIDSINALPPPGWTQFLINRYASIWQVFVRRYNTTDTSPTINSPPNYPYAARIYAFRNVFAAEHSEILSTWSTSVATTHIAPNGPKRAFLALTGTGRHLLATTVNPDPTISGFTMLPDTTRTATSWGGARIRMGWANMANTTATRTIVTMTQNNYLMGGHIILSPDYFYANPNTQVSIL